jgi:hypothetical protein
MKPHAVSRSSEATGPQSLHSPAQVIKRLTAFSLSVLLLPMSEAYLFAQQAPYYPGPQQPYSYNDQYDPGQQYQQPSAPPPPDYGYEQQQQGYGQQPQGLSADQLEQLVAPIALNPDQLVALMLAASTYPAQVQDADHWRQAQGYVATEQIAYGASLQAWDPSVKALTAFPQVLAEMDKNIQWTAALGNAYYNQPQDVLQAIQFMRQRAQAAGNLQSTPQEAVSYNQGYIQVAPVNPQVIYVPAYNPWTVYGQPVDPYPGFSLLGAIGSFFSSGFGSSAVQFGLGTVLSAFSHTPFGLLAWGLDWLSQNLLFHSNNYYSHSASVRDWGLPYGGPRAYMAPHRELAAYNRGYGRGYGQSFNRAGNYNRGYQSGYYNRNQQAYNRGYQSYNRGNYGYRNGLYNQSSNRAGSAFASRPNYGTGGNQAWNHSFAPIRPEQVGRSAYGSNYNSNYRSSLDNRPAFPIRGGFGSNYYYNSSRSSFNQRSDFRSNAFAGTSFNGRSGKSSHSGGFHLFGGGHNSNGFGGGQNFKAPKAPKGFGGGGHSFGGGGHSHGGGGGGGHHSGGGPHH